MTRSALLLASLALAACSSDKLVGPAAQDAVRENQNVAVAPVNAPMVFLDGKEIPAAQVRAIDTKTIQSVQVVKGRAALQRYGARGANGVILIESKAATDSRD